MRQKLFIFIIIFLSHALSQAQSHETGTVSFQLNYDVGVHRTNYTSKFNGILINEDKSAALTSMLKFGAYYNVLNFLSLGIEHMRGGYLEDPDNAEAAGNYYRNLAFGMNLYLVNKDKFNWFISPKFGAARLEIKRRKGVVVETSKYRTGLFGIYTGFNAYLINNLGFNAQLGYSSHNFRMTSFAVGGNSLNLNNFENRLQVGGVHLQLGLSLKF